MADRSGVIEITGPDFSLEFNKEQGTLTSYRFKQKELIALGPLPSFWRAPTDNDSGGDERSFTHRWIEAGLDQLKTEIISIEARLLTSQQAEISVQMLLHAKIDKIAYQGPAVFFSRYTHNAPLKLYPAKAVFSTINPFFDFCRFCVRPYATKTISSLTSAVDLVILTCPNRPTKRPDGGK